MQSIIFFLNPIARLGKRKYSVMFPFITTLLSCILLERYANIFIHDSSVIGILAIFIFISLIIYFAFRDGIGGGVTATVIILLYYIYILYVRHDTGQLLVTNIETTIFLSVIFFFLACIVGWLKQTIDTLLDRELDEKRRLQSIIQQLPVGVIVTDKKGVIIEVNKQVERILGMKVPLGFRIGEGTLFDSSHKGKTSQLLQSPIAQTLITGKSVVGREYVIVRSDNKQVTLQVSASAILNKNGKIIAAASIINDITSQKEMDQRKDDFVNMASHELKTPITSMKLYIDSLTGRIKTYNDEKAITIIGKIRNQTERLQKLVNDLLDVSRLQTGKFSFIKEKFRLDELLEEIIDVFQESAGDKNFIFNKKVSIQVYADRFRMYQVITNIITNAIKYSAEGKEIVIQVYKHKKEVIVSVKDFGIGIAKNEQEKIFERLYQVTNDEEKSFPGFGMGLYISKEIIQRHKGKIWVESEKGKGSIFYFSLPLLKK